MSRILVADDNSNIQKMVTLALKDHGIEVVAVGNGEAAIRKFAEVKPDLVLADIFMPVRNGYEVCEFVKSDPRHAKVPVVLLVGAFDPFDEREAQRVGADGVLKKPFVPPEPLIGMVTGLLAGLEAQKPAREQEVPVEKPVPAMAATTVQASAPFAVEPPVDESAAEEQFGMRQPVEFAVGEQPLAFGELLGSATAEVETSPEIATNTHTDLSESRAWDRPADTEETIVEDREEPSWRRGESLLPKREEVKLPRMMHSAETQEVDAAAPAASEPLQAEWKPIVPPVEEPSGTVESSAAGSSPAAEPQPMVLPSYDGFLGRANPFATEHVGEPQREIAETTASPHEDVPPVRHLPVNPASSEIVSGHLRELAEKTLREAGKVWPNPPAFAVEEHEEVVPPASVAHESAVVVPAVKQAAEPVAETHAPVQSFGVPSMPSPQAIEAVVERVIERMQPQIMEVVRKEILRPVVEALVRRELERKN